MSRPPLDAIGLVVTRAAAGTAPRALLPSEPSLLPPADDEEIQEREARGDPWPFAF